jgi:predicted acylesterase/phospholipase RssA
MLSKGIDTLVVGPGAQKIYTLLGGVRILELEGLLKHTKRFIGCSAGAIICVLLACGYTGLQILDLMLEYPNFLDIVEMSSSFSDAIENVGIFTPEPLRQRFTSILLEKFGEESLTFRRFEQLTGMVFVAVASDLWTKKAVYLSGRTRPDMCIVDAVMASIRIPLLMQVMRTETEVLVDGIVSCPMPMKYAIEISDPSDNIFGIFVGTEPSLLTPPSSSISVHHEQQQQQQQSPLVEGIIPTVIRLYHTSSRSFRREQHEHAILLHKTKQFTGHLDIVILPCAADVTIHATDAQKPDMFVTAEKYMEEYLEKHTGYQQQQQQQQQQASQPLQNSSNDELAETVIKLLEELPKEVLSEVRKWITKA